MLAYIYDIAVAAIVIIFMIVGKKKGFLQIAAKIVGGIAAAICGYALAVMGSVFVFDVLLREKVIGAVEGILPNASGAEDLLKQISEKIAILPGDIGFYGEKKIAELGEVMGKAGEGAAATITDQIISPAAVVIIRTILFIVLFLIFMIIVRMVAKMFGVANRIPIVGGVNKFLGMVVGIGYGALWVIALTMVLEILIPVVNAGILTESAVEGTLYYRYIYKMIG